MPKDAWLQICRLCHDNIGHLSVEKTLRRITRNYWFPKIRRFVSKYIKTCLNCACYKHANGKKQRILNIIEKVPIPFHTFHIDHVDPFQTSYKGNKYLLVVVVAFMKFTLIEPVKNQKSRQVVETILNMIYLFGTPTRIISDRGTAFIPRTFHIFCVTYGIKHKACKLKALNAVPMGSVTIKR